MPLTAVDHHYFRSGNTNDIISNYLGGLPFSINAPIQNEKIGPIGLNKIFYNTPEDEAKDIYLTGKKGSANFTEEESKAIKNIASEIKEAYAQGFLSDVSKLIEDATGRTVDIRTVDPHPIRYNKKEGGFAYREPSEDSFNTMYNTYIVPTSSPGFLNAAMESESVSEDEVEPHKFIPLIEKKHESRMAMSPSDLSGFTTSISSALNNLNGVAG